MGGGLFDDCDLVGLHNGDLLQTHPATRCAGQFCSIHNPSDHPLNTRPLNWRGWVMERTCPHGFGHPDPDDTAWRRRTGRPVRSAHDCDGCCRRRQSDTGGNPEPTP